MTIRDDAMNLYNLITQTFIALTLALIILVIVNPFSNPIGSTIYFIITAICIQSELEKLRRFCHRISAKGQKIYGE